MPKIEAYGIQIYYELHGPEDADVLVLSNGVLMSTASWAFQTPVLSQHYRLLLYDCRGMWQSERPLFLLVPSIYLVLAQFSDFDKYDLTSVRSWASGGSALPPSLVHQFAERGIIIQQGFGMTETGPTAGGSRRLSPRRQAQAGGAAQGQSCIGNHCAL